VPVAQSTITIELIVQGQITPSEGEYIIALNLNTPSGDVNAGEPEGEPVMCEAFAACQNPPPYTHWDQAFVYGTGPASFTRCPPAGLNGFQYCWKAIATSGGQNTISFLNIPLAPNDFIFNAQANFGTGNANALQITLPLNCLAISGVQSTATCGPGGTVSTATTDITQLYVNLITVDNTGIPQDQVACLGQPFEFPVVTTSSPIQLNKPTSGCPAPSDGNANLTIAGGFISMHVLAVSPSPSPSPAASPSPSP
jgi:hypothetical protein